MQKSKRQFIEALSFSSLGFSGVLTATSRLQSFISFSLSLACTVDLVNSLLLANTSFLNNLFCFLALTS